MHDAIVVGLLYTAHTHTHTGAGAYMTKKWRSGGGLPNAYHHRHHRCYLSICDNIELDYYYHVYMHYEHNLGENR